MTLAQIQAKYEASIQEQRVKLCLSFLFPSCHFFLIYFLLGMSLAIQKHASKTAIEVGTDVESLLPNFQGFEPLDSKLHWEDDESDNGGLDYGLVQANLASTQARYLIFLLIKFDLNSLVKLGKAIKLIDALKLTNVILPMWLGKAKCHPSLRHN
jgi:hypothetical protein